ncbi:MAG: L-serine ammonia-lyase, iron-sulfur-dependent, subunit alpha [Bacteroidales bacterium]|nr:L-serine ammonia-lyase, iron-sulfur-dependent, subunit alpha [Bacteroidales bacterium]
MSENTEIPVLTDEERQEILQLLHREVVPAIGCTEPMAVALCVARATEMLGERPVHIDLHLSANILKNAMGVGIPGTGGMIGLPIAVAMGAIGGKSCLGLEVLRDCTTTDLEAARQYIAEDHIDIHLEEKDPDKLFIHAVVSDAKGRTKEATIKGSHTHFEDGSPQVQEQECREQQPMLTLHTVYTFATTAPLDDIRFILEAKRLNEAAAADGLRGNYGHQLGKTMCSPLGRGIMGESIFAKVLSETSCACDARMAGAKIPVMSNSGSGNQGICATMPVVVFARENHNTEEELIRALTLSHLTAVYIKQSLGCLSALCGCVVASTGSSCGITYLMGGDYNQIAHSVKNMIANLTGMICDGAKPSCALKLTTGVSTAVMSAMLAIQHRYVTSAEGIIDDDVDKSIHNLTSIGSRGMDETDRFVLDIMTHKGS